MFLIMKYRTVDQKMGGRFNTLTAITKFHTQPHTTIKLTAKQKTSLKKIEDQ